MTHSSVIELKETTSWAMEGPTKDKYILFIKYILLNGSVFFVVPCMETNTICINTSMNTI